MNNERVRLSDLSTHLEPPAQLEDRIVDELNHQNLLRRPMQGYRPGWLSLVAASIACLAIGFGAGSLRSGDLDGVTLAQRQFIEGSSPDLYAVMLYETREYQAPQPAELRERYDAYSRWVGRAYAAGQFVAGQDLESGDAWIISPGDADEVTTAPAEAIADVTGRLSGMFFIRGDSEQEVLALVKVLPHVQYGGAVVVQKTIPTSEPPEVIL